MTEQLWTNTEIDILRRCWTEDSKSAGMIAKELNRSRSSVCGKLQRLHLNRHEQPSKQVLSRGGVRPKKVRSPPLQPEPEFSHGPVSLADLEWWHCHALIDTADVLNPTYCGRRKLGKSEAYCAEHHKRFHHHG